MTRSLLLVAALASPMLAQQQPSSFVNFESPQTHPLAIAADGSELYAVNTPDNRLAVFSLRNPDRPVLVAEIPVGLEPVSVTPRTSDEVWVANRLSDSVSVVSISRRQVLETIQVKDEPADVLFAGSPAVALVTASGSREVRVFDVTTHAELARIAVFGDEPRALARSTDGKTAWVAVHRSGNQTTVIPEDKAPPPPPPTNPQLPPAPQQSLIVSATDPTWKSVHGLTLPDYDVLELDVAQRKVARRYSGLGTILFNVAVHPSSGELWIANQEARNLLRFEPTLRGHIVDSRLTRLTPGGAPQAAFFDLNPRIDYSLLPNPAAQASALAQPTDLVWSADGSTLWVAAFGTDRVAAVDAQGQVTGFVELGAPGSQADPRTKRGPRGLALHPTQPRLYVLNRIAMTLAVLDTQAPALLREQSLGWDPTPRFIADGRGFLYDAKLSGNGTAACAACHIDGEIDGLGWDLGDPSGQMIAVNNFGNLYSMHPMKGPMTTQTLRGLTPNVAPFHWRGDKSDIQAFNPAFDKLLGNVQLATPDIDAFASFAATLSFPPNPNQNLDRTYPSTPVGTSALDGFNFFLNTPFIASLTCALCHQLPAGTPGVIIPGIALQESQDFKIPQLRNIYKRQGRVPVNSQSISGFGLLHDGSVDNVFGLLSKPVFQSLSRQTTNKQKLEAFVTAFDTGMAPAVGHSVTVDAQNLGSGAVQGTLALLLQEAGEGDCDLAVKGTLRGGAHGLWWNGSAFAADQQALGTFTLAQLSQEIAQGGATLTFFGVPPGSGQRIGIDRNENGVPDFDDGVLAYGAPTPACAPPLRLAANSTPQVGNALLALLCSGAPAGGSGILLLGTGQSALPFYDLTILVDPTGAAVLPMAADGQGLGIAELPVPSDPALGGAVLFAQAAFPAGCAQLGVAASDGLRLTIVP